MWSRELQELSEIYFEYNGTYVKSINGEFGILSIDYQNKIYTITIKPELTKSYSFHSTSEMIKSGWAVD